MPFFFLLLLLSLLTSITCSCNPPHRLLLSLAFSTVTNFLPPPPPSNNNPCIRHLLLPSQNLSGTISWMFLRNITTLQTLDLSSNSLSGTIPGNFWTAPALTHVNLAGNHLGGSLRFDQTGLRFLNLSANRFTVATGFSNLANLRVLDLSRNKLRDIPPDMNSLLKIEYLDVSYNAMVGRFPADFPATSGMKFLNVSCNKLTGEVDSDALEKFGSSAFEKAGVFSEGKRGKRGLVRKGVVAGMAAGGGVLVVVIAGGICWWVKQRRRRPEKVMEREEVGWVKEAKWGAAVVVFEKPLMELKFGDLAAATSGFGRESLMAEGGRSGDVYRAVLPGGMDVVIRVMESWKGVGEEVDAAAFSQISRLRHRNILPLFGYCISGKEKLLLYEYMQRGDLHRWLHELPSGRPDGDDFTADTWDNPASTSSVAASSISDWPTRHRIALGVARGLAFLHQGWVGSHTPVVHGRLVTSNILLSDDLEPRIADFAGAGDATAEDDVYSYGVLVMELVTGSSRCGEEVERVRGVVRDGGIVEVDRRLRMEAVWEKEAAECLRVGYLCTAGLPEKRPTMQQVVALLKDIRQVVAAGEVAAG